MNKGTMNKETMNKAVFLDRDGTLIEDHDYICTLEESKIFPFAAEAVRLMNDGGYRVIGITNQSSIARGICTKEQVETIHREIMERLQKEGAHMERFYYCPYHPEGAVAQYRKFSSCRKPAPGMLLQAAADYDIDLSQSIMMGDNWMDIAAGLDAGCRTVLVLTGKNPARQLLAERNLRPDLVTDNILTAMRELRGRDPLL